MDGPASNGAMKQLFLRSISVSTLFREFTGRKEKSPCHHLNSRCVLVSVCAGRCSTTLKYLVEKPKNVRGSKDKQRPVSASLTDSTKLSPCVQSQ